ncbi:MAG: GNAT family N-acetyltransferase [Lachnospiraceae bacterium]|nr:GNAT family N-acetyltransferase [Lachnospiraceae bacterium]
MFKVERMQETMREDVMAMVEEFYHSDAVSHPVKRQVLEQTFADAVGSDPVLNGYVLTEDGRIVGFAYTTVYYACEVGGRCMMFEEIYLKKETRGKGYGTRFLELIMEENPQVKRFRLEVTRSNEGAVRLYEKLGFSFLEYDQMVLDRQG